MEPHWVAIARHMEPQQNAPTGPALRITTTSAWTVDLRHGETSRGPRFANE